MELLSENLVKLVGYVAWPATVIFACVKFHQPLSELVATLSRRITKFSVFKVDVELGRLSEALSLGATVETLRQVAVSKSGMAIIVAGLAGSGSADYLVIDIGTDDEKSWLTSRLFLLAALLERSRSVRCLVFLDKTKHFVGAATARDVRSAIGARYLGYEVAFASAHSFLGVDQNVFRGGLNEKLVTSLSSGFLANDLISSMNNPGKAGWVELKQATPFPTTWEFADWVTAASLKDILGQRLLTGSVVASIGPVSPQITKVLVKSPGPFVALVDQDKVFVEICDRYAVVESVAREAIDQSADA